MSIINGKWKLLIIKELFSELHQKMLTKQLRELEYDYFINRKVYPQVPPKVEYSLTSVGESLEDVLDVMHKWGESYVQKRLKDGN